VIALVGRPNVGKSTLFNRLIGRRVAIVAHDRGTTRDRLYGTLTWRGVSFTLIDTGGVEWDLSPETGGGITAAVQNQLRRAVQEADGIVAVCDARDGLLPSDERLIADLRKTGKPCLVVVNKLDGQALIPPEFFSLGGIGIIGLSALLGEGFPAFLDQLSGWAAGAGRVPAPLSSERPFDSGPGLARGAPPPAVAIIGRQNVGKSSLMNALLAEERVIVSEQPGTTRDAVDTMLEHEGRQVLLIDTAGLRHRRKVRAPVDTFAMARAREAIARCDVALIVLDATQGVTRDDQRIMTQACEAGCGCVLVVNKWDLVRPVATPSAVRIGPMSESAIRTPPSEIPGGLTQSLEGMGRLRLEEAIHRQAPSMGFAPVIATCAVNGWQVGEALKTALRIARTLSHPLSDAACHTILQQTWKSLPPPRHRGRAIHLHRARWLPGRPARLALRVTPAASLSRPYQRALLKRLWRHPQWAGIPIKFLITSS
jgi:GTP-binding protein